MGVCVLHCRTDLSYTNGSLEYFHRIQVLIVVTENRLCFLSPELCILCSGKKTQPWSDIGTVPTPLTWKQWLLTTLSGDSAAQSDALLIISVSRGKAISVSHQSCKCTLRPFFSWEILSLGQIHLSTRGINPTNAVWNSSTQGLKGACAHTVSVEYSGQWSQAVSYWSVCHTISQENSN